MAKKHSSKGKSSNKEDRKFENRQIVGFVVIGILAVVFLSQFIFSGSGDGMETNTQGSSTPLGAESSEIDSFAQCLTDEGAVFYGTDWCPHCTRQKEMFGNSMDHVNYVDCDEEQSVCSSQGIRGYPTWKVDGKNEMMGVQTFDRLAAATGCEL